RMCFSVPRWVVVFDRRGVSHLGLIGVHPELAAGTALLKQVPALIEGDLETVQLGFIVVVEPVLLCRLPIERVLLVDHLTDAIHDLLIFHRGAPMFPFPRSYASALYAAWDGASTSAT